MREFLLTRGFILPVVVTGVVPTILVILSRGWSRATVTSWLAGVPVYAAGIGMLGWTTGLFDRHDGSLAPWNPPTELVIEGPYRWCRNPMISGIFAMLLGETIIMRSKWIAGWFALFVTIQHLFVCLHEEPDLSRRFGAPYDEYRRRVPRWIPKTPS